MPGKIISRIGTEVKALRIVLITLLILYGLVFISFTFILVRAPSRSVMVTLGVTSWGQMRYLLDKVLVGPIYFFIAYSIFKLIGLISRGECFNPTSPRHIRRIGYGVFCLALFYMMSATIGEFTAPEVNISDSILRLLYGGLTTVLLGFGFLVIARVLEAGVRLQQDQNLTV
jgi:hypothetical protein